MLSKPQPKSEHILYVYFSKVSYETSEKENLKLVEDIVSSDLHYCT